MKTIRIFSIALLSSLTLACSSEFLESTPIMSNVESQFYSNDQEMFQGLVACYDPLQWSGWAMCGVTVPFGEIVSDNANCGGGSESDQPDMQAMEDFENTADCTISYALWMYKYKGLYRCNKLINQEYTSDLAEVYKAEAKFLRAWYHFDLMRHFGPCVVSTIADYPNEYEFVRSTREEVNAQIEQDLLDAIPLLEDTFGSDMTGRITKNTAQALLAKHYIYAADWDNDNTATFAKAIPLLEEIISDGHYTLLNDYSQIWGYLNTNCSESIFEVQRSTSSGAGWGADNIDAGEGAYWAAAYSPRGLSNHPIYELGWGFTLPTQDLYNFFLEDDTARRDAVVLTFEELDGQVNSDGVVSTWDTTQYGPDFEGFASQKYAIESECPEVGNVYINAPGNERLIRYGEIFLLLAEANLRGGGSETKAIELIETLRAAHVPGGMSVAEMMTKYPDRFPTVLDVLWYERRAELAGEGDRWFDLVRSGRAESTMTKFVSEGRVNNNITLNWEKRMNYLPVSNTETGSCPSISTYPDEAFE